MKRRTFIQQTSAAGALIGLGGLTVSSANASNTKKINIHHTNEVHSHIDPFAPDDGRNAN